MSKTESTEEFLERFRALKPHAQADAAYDIAAKHVPEFSTPANVRRLAAGIRFGVLHEPLPGQCEPRCRKGWKIGNAIRDGQVTP